MTTCSSLQMSPGSPVAPSLHAGYLGTLLGTPGWLFLCTHTMLCCGVASFLPRADTTEMSQRPEEGNRVSKGDNCTGNWLILPCLTLTAPWAHRNRSSNVTQVQAPKFTGVNAPSSCPHPWGCLPPAMSPLTPPSTAPNFVLPSLLAALPYLDQCHQ